MHCADSTPNGVVKATPDHPHPDLQAIADRSEIVKRAATRESNARGYVRNFPICVGKGEGVKVQDDVTKEWYWDCLACAGTLALGHCHPVTVKAMTEFIQMGYPTQTLDMATPLKDEFVTELRTILPEKLTRVHFCSPAGTDCLDAAVKLCKIKTGRRTVMAFAGGYHGHGQGPLAMMGNLDTKSLVPGLMTDVQFLPYPYKYRQPFGMEGEAGDRAVMKYIETILNDVESGVPKPACVVLECIQGEGGCGEFPDEALRELRRITQEHGIYMIVDEVQSGFCRSGNFFSFQRSGIVPDVLCMSKALGGGMPMAVMAFKEELNVWSPGAHTGTFRGNQMAFATGKASIRYMMESKLWEQVAEKGVHFKGLLNKIKEDFPVIGDIRGRGLMVGIEFVDAQNRDHVGVPKPHGDIAKKVQRECFKRKLILERGGRCGAVIRFLPPLIITNEELTAVAGIFREAIECALQEFNLTRNGG